MPPSSNQDIPRADVPSAAANIGASAPPPSAAVNGNVKNRKKWFLISGVGFLFLAAVSAAGYFFTASPGSPEESAWRAAVERIFPPKTRTFSREEILSAIRKEIIPSVVQVRCVMDDSGEEGAVGSGLYYLDRETGAPSVETNAHVILGDDGVYRGCNVYFPRASDGSFYDSVYAADGEALSYNDLESIVGGLTVSGLDYAVLRLAGSHLSQQRVEYPFPPERRDAYAVMQEFCTEGTAIEIGAPVYVIGYPGIGGSSVTLTEGIVSGFSGDHGEYVKVSATTNSGNSGGVAIGVENGCNYGIPTRATFAPGSNLGLLLSPSFTRAFMDGYTGEKTYTPDSQTERFAVYPSAAFGISIEYPQSWSIGEKDSLVTFTAPSEGALDSFEEYVSLEAAPGFLEDVRSTAYQYVDELKQKYSGVEVSGPLLGTTDSGFPYFVAVFPLDDEKAVAVAHVQGDNRIYTLTGVFARGARVKEYASLMDSMIVSIK